MESKVVFFSKFFENNKYARNCFFWSKLIRSNKNNNLLSQKRARRYLRKGNSFLCLRKANSFSFYKIDRIWIFCFEANDCLNYSWLLLVWFFKMTKSPINFFFMLFPPMMLTVLVLGTATSRVVPAKKILGVKECVSEKKRSIAKLEQIMAVKGALKKFGKLLVGRTTSSRRRNPLFFRKYFFARSEARVWTMFSRI